MNLSTRTQFISALVVAAAWACSAEPAGPTTTSQGGTTSVPTAGTGGAAAGSTGTAGTATAGTQGGGGTPAGGAGGTAPAAGAGGTAPAAGAGGTAGGAGGAGGTQGGGGTAGTAPTSCPNLPGVVGHPDCAATYDPVPGFTLALVEEFAAPIDLVNDPIWTYSDGHPDGPVRFVKEGISFADGKMILTMSDTPVEASHSYAEEEDVDTRAYSSGEFRTKYNNYRYGRYEVRFKAPSVIPGDTTTNGGYVATMFIFRNPKFTNWREIDLEQIGDSPTVMGTNLINGDNKQAWGAEFADTADSPHTIPFNARADFHDYAFEWTSESVTWYADGVQIRQQVGPAKLPIPEMSAKIMMNLWWGSFGGNGATNQWPLVTEYEWFRFYKWDMETTYPVADPTMLPQTDLDGAKNNTEDGITYIPPNNGN
jgi:beta-glucanase (GH16 family)